MLALVNRPWSVGPYFAAVVSALALSSCGASDDTSLSLQEQRAESNVVEAGKPSAKPGKPSKPASKSIRIPMIVDATGKQIGSRYIFSDLSSAIEVNYEGQKYQVALMRDTSHEFSWETGRLYSSGLQWGLPFREQAYYSNPECTGDAYISPLIYGTAQAVRLMDGSHVAYVPGDAPPTSITYFSELMMYTDDMFLQCNSYNPGGSTQAGPLVPVARAFSLDAYGMKPFFFALATPKNSLDRAWPQYYDVNGKVVGPAVAGSGVVIEYQGRVIAFSLTRSTAPDGGEQFDWVKQNSLQYPTLDCSGPPYIFGAQESMTFGSTVAAAVYEVNGKTVAVLGASAPPTSTNGRLSYRPYPGGECVFNPNPGDWGWPVVETIEMDQFGVAPFRLR